MLKIWVFNFGSPFVNLFQLPGIVELAIIAPILFLVLYSMVYMLRNASWKSSLFVMLLIVVNFGILMLVDIVVGAMFSTPSRYISFTLIALILPVAYLLASKITIDDLQKRQLWAFVMIVVIGLSLLSSTLMVLSPIVSGKGNDEDFIQVVQILNEQESPVLIVDQLGDDVTFGNVLALSHYLNDDMQFRFVQDINNFTGDTSGRLFWLHTPNDTAQNDGPSNWTSDKYTVNEVVPGLLWDLTAK